MQKAYYQLYNPLELFFLQMKVFPFAQKKRFIK